MASRRPANWAICKNCGEVARRWYADVHNVDIDCPKCGAKYQEPRENEERTKNMEKLYQMLKVSWKYTSQH